MCSQEPASANPAKTNPPVDLRIGLPALLVAAGVLAYANSFSGAFLFDDFPNVVGNERIRTLWPPWEVLNGRRPVVDLSLAINYALGGLNVRGYHAFNLAVHLLAALTLFGLVRRTLWDRLSSRSNDRLESLSHRQAGRWPALAVALIWVVHPLQTQSVTYVIQRGESMTGLFYLLTLYCVIRGLDSAFRSWWYSAAVASCLLGMGSKAVMVTAPLMVLLYDRAFVAHSFSRALRRRWPLYVGLTASWTILVVCGVARGVLGPPHSAPATVGFGVKEVSPLAYALTQPGVMLHYLRLSFWPHPLCLDYGWPMARTAAAIAVPALVVGALMAGTVWAFRRKPRLGFCGAWFFVILAPTSSLVPIRDPLNEHRMYLPLAGLIVLIVLVGRVGLRSIGRRLSLGDSQRLWLVGGVVGTLVATFAYVTNRRNEDYRSPVSMWSDVVSKRPENHRAHYNLARLLVMERRVDEGVESFRVARRLRPESAEVQLGLGLALVARGDLDEAINVLRRAVTIAPDFVNAYVNLGKALVAGGRLDEAIDVFRQARRVDPASAAAHHGLGRALSKLGRVAEAVEAYREALRFEPDHPGIRRGLEEALAMQRRANHP